MAAQPFSLSPHSPLNLALMRLWYAMLEWQDKGLAIDHTDSAKWEYGIGHGKRPLTGGAIWGEIDRLNAEILEMLDRAGLLESYLKQQP